MEPVTVGFDDGIWKEALTQRTLVDLDAAVDGGCKVTRVAPRREGGHEVFVWEEGPNRGHCTNQIAVTRDDKRDIERISVGVGHHLDSDVDVRHLFMVSGICVPAARTADLVREKTPKVNGKVGQGTQCLQIGVLAALLGGAVDTAGKIVNVNQILFLAKEALHHFLDVEPLGPGPLAIADSMVEVEPVDVGNDALHGLSRRG